MIVQCSMCFCLLTGLTGIDGWMARLLSSISQARPDLPQMCSQDAKPKRHKDTLGSQGLTMSERKHANKKGI